MAEEMILLENIMPVEIALKREQEYRKKVEALLTQQQCDSENNDVFLLKEPLRNLSGTKRKEPSTDGPGTQSLQPPKSSKAFQKQPAGLLCLACEVVFSTFYYLRQHCGSQAHKERLFQTRRGKKPISNPLWCELCNVPSSSEVSLESHLNGIKHATALQELENAKLGRRGRLGCNYSMRSTGIENSLCEDKMKEDSSDDKVGSQRDPRLILIFHGIGACWTPVLARTSLLIIFLYAVCLVVICMIL